MPAILAKIFFITKRACPSDMIIRDLIRKSSSIFTCFDKKCTKIIHFLKLQLLKISKNAEVKVNFHCLPKKTIIFNTSFHTVYMLVIYSLHVTNYETLFRAVKTFSKNKSPNYISMTSS